MISTFKRLQENQKSIFLGKQINRLKPIKFKLNGNEIKAFAGDSVLSAAIANGIISAGTHLGHELALDETLSLPIAHSSKNITDKDCLPIERTPAINGAKFITIGGKISSSLARLVKKTTSKPITSLGVNFDDNSSNPNPWLEQEIDENINVDLLVIGAGVAGMSAAAHGANSNRAICLIEQRAYCGGDAILFGHGADEKNPIDIITSLKKDINDAPNISVMTSSKAINIIKNTVRVHRVVLIDGLAKSKIYQIKAKKIILATGCADRLPIFSGNRLAGTIGLTSAFHLAYGYGVWPHDITSDSSAIITTNNIAYRFATLSADAGVKIEKIIDSRIELNSRFAQFAKAYGIKSETGIKPGKIIFNSTSRKLNLQARLTIGENDMSFAPIIAKSIIISGGWLPRVFLWHLAGGKVAPIEGSFGLEAKGKLNNIALAGSCANWVSTKAAIQSGIEAFNILFRRKTYEVADERIEQIFETLGDYTPISLNKQENLAPHYYDRGTSLTCQTNNKANNIFQKIYQINKKLNFDEPQANKSLSLADLSIACILGKLPISDFDEISKERTIAAANICITKTKNKPTRKKRIPFKIPHYLEGSFGEKAKIWEVSTSSDFHFETGNLIYANSDINNPLQALGVIIGQLEGKNIALISNALDKENQQISIASSGGHILAKTTKEYLHEMKS